MDKKLFIMDIDGTLARGKKLIDGAAELIEEIQRQGLLVCYLTNNSSMGIKEYLEKFRNWGIKAKEEEFITAGTYAIDFLKKNYGNEKIYVEGTESFLNECRIRGLNVTDQAEGVRVVLSTYDKELTYEKVKRTCEILHDESVIWYATNMDECCPGENGMIPDCAGICRMIETAVKRKPKYLGKPGKDIAEYALSCFGIRKEAAVIVGDRLYTDIQCGRNTRIDTCLVMTGEETQYSDDPTWCFYSVKDLYAVLKRKRLNQEQIFPDWPFIQSETGGYEDYPFEKIYSDHKGWIKGDLHIHTDRSDGHDSPQILNLRTSKAGLEYYAVTDHNYLHSDWPLSSALVLPAVEVTLVSGHMNIFGMTEIPESLKMLIDRKRNLDLTLEEETIILKKIMEECYERQCIISINHPFLDKWSWKYKDIDFRMIDCLEIDNNPTFDFEPEIEAEAANQRAVELADRLWAEKYRICAVGGSDVHLSEKERYGDSKAEAAPGLPATWVYVDKLTPQNLLDAIRKSHVYVSRKCKVDFYGRFIDNAGDELHEQYVFGDELPDCCYHIVFELSLLFDSDVEEESLKEIEVFYIKNGEKILLNMTDHRHSAGLKCDAQQRALHFSGKITLEHEGYQWIRFGAQNKEKKLIFYANPFYRMAR